MGREVWYTHRADSAGKQGSMDSNSSTLYVVSWNCNCFTTSKACIDTAQDANFVLFSQQESITE